MSVAQGKPLGGQADVLAVLGVREASGQDPAGQHAVQEAGAPEYRPQAGDVLHRGIKGAEMPSPVLSRERRQVKRGAGAGDTGGLLRVSIDCTAVGARPPIRQRLGK